MPATPSSSAATAPMVHSQHLRCACRLHNDCCDKAHTCFGILRVQCSTRSYPLIDNQYCNWVFLCTPQGFSRFNPMQTELEPPPADLEMPTDMLQFGLADHRAAFHLSFNSNENFSPTKSLAHQTICSLQETWSELSVFSNWQELINTLKTILTFCFLSSWTFYQGRRGRNHYKCAGCFWSARVCCQNWTSNLQNIYWPINMCYVVFTGIRQVLSIIQKFWRGTVVNIFQSLAQKSKY